MSLVIMVGSGHSKEFFDLVKAIGESKSKQEEDNIMMNEIHNLKEKLNQPKISVKSMKECLIRLIYVEMLGHDGNFGHIHAIKMINDPNLLVKRLGYLASSLCLHSEHQLMVLMVNSLQKDLQSSNYLETSMALHAISKLISKDLIPAIFPLLEKSLSHRHPAVRKKAIMALQRCAEIDNSLYESNNGNIRRLLCDKDPSVMGATLHIIYDMVSRAPEMHLDLIPSLVSILKQITEHRLPREYDYHRMPAPWIQIVLLQTLGILGSMNKSGSESMYEVLNEVIRRADIGINVGYALLYECVRAITCIYPNKELLLEASKCVSRFITSDNHNLKYLGINALSLIVKVDPAYALEHQMLVIDYLEDPDDSLRRKTLNLLYSMTNPSNVVIVVEKLLVSLQSTLDQFLRVELVTKISQLSEKYAPDTFWYIDAMNNQFLSAGNIIEHSVAHNLMKVISQDSESVNENGLNTREYSVNVYIQMLQKPVLPDILLKTIAWILGEFGHLCDLDELQVINLLMTMFERAADDPHEIKSWVFSSIMKICARSPKHIPVQVYDLVERFRFSVNVDLQQRAHEFFELIQQPEALQFVLPKDSLVNVGIDEELEFLDGYVEKAVRAGAEQYNSNWNIESIKPSGDANAMFNFTPYSTPDMNSSHKAEVNEEQSSGEQLIEERIPQIRGLKTNKSVGGKWGPSGYNSSTRNDIEAKGNPNPTPKVSVGNFQSTSSADYHAQQTYNSDSRAEVTTKYPERNKQSHQDIEKKRVANLLFSGVGSTNSVKKNNNTAIRSRISDKQVTPKVQSQQKEHKETESNAPGPDEDLLDLFSMESGSHMATKDDSLLNIAMKSSPDDDPLAFLNN